MSPLAHTNPVDPNNPYQSQPPQIPSTPSQPPYPSFPNLPDNPDLTKHSHYSEVAQHKSRDEHGRFVPQPHYPLGNSLPTPNIPETSNPSDIPQTESNFTKCLKVLKSITKIKWGTVSTYLIGFIGVITFLFSLPPVKSFVEANFPNSSPIFNREVAHQGILKS